ncbi:peptide ABC transporter permease [Planctomycetaceae bacterium SCGC AG-212-D15]|nr:peptide ABC transporter permease [Planctomycetaceae bacterium SCGC AG-212-D15]
MSYSLATLWHERNRFLPGVLAVAFSALLIALQCGLLLGLFSITSIPVDDARADIWVGHPNVLSVDLGRPIPSEWLGRVAQQPDVERAELYLQGFSHWGKPTGGTQLCMVVGCRLMEGAMGAVKQLTPELRARLTEPRSVVVDASEIDQLGIHGVGDYAEVAGNRVRVVGLVNGLKSLAGPYVLCSLSTARQLLVWLQPDQTVYVLARCKPGVDPAGVVTKLCSYPNMSAFTREEFSLRSRMHWLTKTKAGIALGLAAVLGLMVGAVVTSQTLYAATVASLREYAVLRALGIPRWRMALSVLAQSFWVGVAGVALALPTAAVLARLGDGLGAKVLLPGWLVALAIGITMLMAMLSGLAALRSLRLVEPAVLLR